MTQYETIIEDGTIYVAADVGRVEVGPLSAVLEFHGETHTKEYSSFEKQRYGDEISMADEGLETSVRAVVENMTHSSHCLDMLKNKPLKVHDDSNLGVTRRMAVFLGMVGENLDNGVM